MNERIKQLAKQVWPDPNTSHDNHMKFAELIVRECARIASNADLEDVEGGDSSVLRAVNSQILEHFGVEE